MKKQINYDRYGNYIINRGESLGSGTFGKVYKGYRILSENSFGNYQRLRLQPVAIKQSFCEAQNYQQINILKILNHPNIIRYIDYKIHGNSLFMIMELCQQGTLQDFLMNLPEDQNLHDILIIYYGQIISGIKFMYDKKILHRDIKPSNILIKDNMVKIADFGTSKQNSEKELRTLVGTPLFSSPQLLEISIPAEQQLNTPIKSTYTQRSDIWSLGLVLYLMFNYQKNHDKQGDRLRNSLPWCGKHPGQVLKNIQTLPLQYKKAIPQNIKNIIQKMLKINPSQRMSFKQLFTLEQFQQKSIKHLKINLNQSNLAISKSFVMKNSIEDQFCLTNANGKQQQACIAEQIQKKQIDWQLLKLLQIKDSQHYQDDQIKQAIQFYNLLLNQLNQLIDAKSSGQKQKQKQKQKFDNQLLFLIQKKLYQLQSWRLWNIQYQNKQENQQQQIIRITQQKQQNKSNYTLMKIDIEIISQLLQQIKSHYNASTALINQLQNTMQQEIFSKVVEKPDTQDIIITKQKIIINFIKPNEKLLKYMKLFIKKNLNQQLLSNFNQNKIKCNMDLTQVQINNRKKIFFIYDIFTFIQFQFSWKIKSQLSSSYGKQYNVGYTKNSFIQTFKSLRNSVNIKQIISRIKEAYNYLKIANVKDIKDQRQDDDD